MCLTVFSAAVLAFASCAGTDRPFGAAIVEDAKTSGPDRPGPDKPAFGLPADSGPKRPESEAPAPAGEKKSGTKAASRDASPLEFVAERAAPASGRATGSAATRAPSESGLKAGWADDNAQYNLFLDFLKKHADEWPFRPVPAEGRILAAAVDADGNGVPDARATIRRADGTVLETVRTYADGSIILTPPANGIVEVQIESSAGNAGARVDPAGARSVRIELPGRRRIPTPVPLDIVFVMDTTGSMGEEIERLKATVEIIRDNLDLAQPRPALRFGLVLYKDRGDEYIVRSYPLTEDLEAFRKNLAKAYADGGGDEPEDLEAALEAAVSPAMGWRPAGARLAFVVTDAPAHAYDGTVGYDISTERAREAAIKIHTIGTGGLPLPGEYQLRQIAQRTRGRYIFLTYGERGESEGGVPGAVSHHTGSNWTADKLEAVIIRFAKEELAFLGAEGTRTPDEDYFEAKKVGAKGRDEILDELFAGTVGRLLDYSSAAIPADTPAAVLPTRPLASDADKDAGLEDSGLKRNAEYFGLRFLQAAAASKRLRVVERADLQALLSEWELRLSGVGDAEDAAKLGELLGAELLIAPTLVRRSAAGEGEWELSARLIRVRTGEILSIARARIAGSLGL